MKKLLLLSLFMIAHFISNAQEWAPIGTEWYYTHLYWWTPDIDFNHWVSAKDTTINGQHCRIIEKTHFACDLRPYRNFMYGENRRIYFFNERTENFEVLYDFNLEAGDSLKIPNWLDESLGFEFEPDTIIYLVDSTSTFAWNDSTYIKQYISHYIPYWGEYEYFTAIENIGGTNQMFNYSPGICDGEYDGPLRCYNSPETGLINFGTVACDYTPVEKVIADPKIRVFPNPVTDQLLVNLNSELHVKLEFKIYDYSGKWVHAGVIDGTSNPIDLSRLSSGIYMLRLFDSGIPVNTQKIVKM